MGGESQVGQESRPTFLHRNCLVYDLATRLPQHRN